jgi:hypothetical protein
MRTALAPIVERPDRRVVTTPAPVAQEPLPPTPASIQRLDVSERKEITPDLGVGTRPPREPATANAPATANVAPQVNITIGRVEVHAAPPRPAPVRAETPRPAAQRRAPVSLDEYLRRRERPA